MYSVTKHYAKQAVNDGKRIIKQIKNDSKHYHQMMSVLQDVYHNTKIISKIAPSDQQNFANYNLKKLIDAGFKLHFSECFSDIDDNDDICHYINNEHDWLNSYSQYYNNCFDYIIHHGKNYIITTVKKYKYWNYSHFQYVSASHTHKSNTHDLQNAVLYLEHYYAKVYGYYSDEIAPFQEDVNFIKHFSSIRTHKAKYQVLLKNIKADCLAIHLHQMLTRRFSKTEHHYLIKDFLAFKSLTLSNSEVPFLFRSAGISTVKDAIILNQQAPSQSSYEHMVSSYDVAKKFRDAKILPRLKRNHIQYVQNNSTDVGDPEPYIDNGSASDNTHTVKPLQADTVATLIDASQDSDHTLEYF